jgi:hypothetical protein
LKGEPFVWLAVMTSTVTAALPRDLTIVRGDDAETFDEPWPRFRRHWVWLKSRWTAKAGSTPPRALEATLAAPGDRLLGRRGNDHAGLV